MSKLYTNDNLVHNYRSYKALIAAKYSGKSYTLVNNADNAQEKHFYKLPALECSDNGNLFENNAIAYHLANDSLRGTSELNKAEVVQWLCWAQTDLWPSVFAWILPALGLSNQKQLSDDWTVDYESYDWKKLNPDEESTKKLVEEYFSWSGQFGGKKFNQGKIFK
ncbi:Elongation factor 1-gamma [Sarcoptes scabiei]|nr:Elongation factor 1-gamma [Sarcoptes scabiei]